MFISIIKNVIIIFLEPPSEELVNRVKELYQSRVSDVRFLIPVLNGLSKNEIFNALPHLIKLNPNVVKEVSKPIGLYFSFILSEAA